jgi:hypothetical protein
MSKGGVTRMRAFILAQEADSQSIADYLKKFGIEATNPVMEGGRSDNVTDNLRHELSVLLNGKFTHVIMGPDCELLEHAVALACVAGNLKLEFVNVEKVLSQWKRLSSPAMVAQ